PSNEKRGYVLRRILRRAVRYYWLLGRREPMLGRLVDVVVNSMSGAYPELSTRREHLLATTQAEEELFLSTIDGGMREIDAAMPEGGSGTLAGDVAFKLKDTYGIPEDLTDLIARERGYAIDWDGFRDALEAQRARSRAGVETAVTDGVPDELARLTADVDQRFTGYTSTREETAIGGYAESDRRVALVLADNPFYAESGGQVSDAGIVRGAGWRMDVSTVWKNADGQTVVAGELTEGAFDPTGPVIAEVDARLRADTERNHTATHLLHAALRERLGDHVQQAGSLVAPDRLRFDFTHRGPLSDEERASIETRVNHAILANAVVSASERDYEEALAAGAMALFGEKYGDVVRVVDVEGLSQELCGGTHVRTTGQIGSFRIIAETGVAAGIRRVEALTGSGAYEWTIERERVLTSVADRLRASVPELAGRIDRLLEERDRLEREASSQRGEATADQVERLLREVTADGARFLSGRIELPAGTDLGDLGDLLRDRIDSAAVVLHVVFPDEGRHAFVSVVSDDLIRDGLKAGDLVRVSSKATGSGGGGRPHFAQGGVGDPERADDGLGAAKKWASERVPDLVG
ncbi:MAG: alanine--tRNA ligase-related protein, partial [Gemmatimonadetes bacterium]|nr:alanine--tRNA ligase-related protein [Gemmatimonadota bacterium]